MNTNPERPLHVVFGSGEIGHPLAAMLLERGHRVRVVRRSEKPVPPGVELVRGDALDAGFVRGACGGASVVYHAMNAPYFASVWAEQLPRLSQNLIAGAGAAGARLVVLDNLYMLGAPGGKPLNEDTPVHPRSRKGEIRARVAEMLFEAHRRGDVRAVSGRASDYYGPRGTETNFGEYFWKPTLAGKAGALLIDPDMPHTYHYTRDVAAGLATLGEAPDDVTGGWWMLPAAPALPARALIGAFAKALGRPIEVKRMHPLMVAGVSLFMPALREMREMAYQWDEPFVADDTKFRTRFGVTATPVDEGAKATVAWAKEAFGAA